jgi:hypothetical protein
MKLTRKTIAIALVAFTVTAIASFAPPIAAQTASVELLQVKPKWKHLDLSENPWQILYAKVRNNGTEPVLVQVEFEVISSAHGTTLYLSDVAYLPAHPPNPLRLEVTFEVGIPDKYYVAGILYYRAEGAEWIRDGVARSLKQYFIAV